MSFNSSPLPPRGRSSRGRGSIDGNQNTASSIPMSGVLRPKRLALPIQLTNHWVAAAWATAFLLALIGASAMTILMASLVLLLTQALVASESEISSREAAAFEQMHLRAPPAGTETAWLNALVVTTLWPALRKSDNSIAAAKAAATNLDYYKPDSIASIDVEELDFSPTPPVIGAVRVIHRSKPTGSVGASTPSRLPKPVLVLDLDITWASDWKMVVALKTKSKLLPNVKITMGELKVAATIRLTLDASEAYSGPIKRITFAFTSRPNIASLSMTTGGGALAMTELPFVKSWLRKALTESWLDYYIAPDRQVYDLEHGLFYWDGCPASLAKIYADSGEWLPPPTELPEEERGLNPGGTPLPTHGTGSSHRTFASHSRSSSSSSLSSSSNYLPSASSSASSKASVWAEAAAAARARSASESSSRPSSTNPRPTRSSPPPPPHEMTMDSPRNRAVSSPPIPSNVSQEQLAAKRGSMAELLKTFSAPFKSSSSSSPLVSPTSGESSTSGSVSSNKLSVPTHDSSSGNDASTSPRRAFLRRRSNTTVDPGQQGGPPNPPSLAHRIRSAIRPNSDDPPALSLDDINALMDQIEIALQSSKKHGLDNKTDKALALEDSAATDLAAIEAALTALGKGKRRSVKDLVRRNHELSKVELQRAVTRSETLSIELSSLRSGRKVE